MAHALPTAARFLVVRGRDTLARLGLDSLEGLLSPNVSAAVASKCFRAAGMSRAN
jgi:hypothetical protein